MGVVSMLPLDEHLLWSYRLAKFEVAGERRGVGRTSFARFEENLTDNLKSLATSGATLGQVLRRVDPGRVWLRPKAVERRLPRTDGSSLVSIPEHANDHEIVGMTVRVLLEPTPEFAIAEILWLRRFGPALETILASTCLGNRLDLRGTPRTIALGGRRVYTYWAPAYKRFREGALEEARRSLAWRHRRCLLVTLDLASYYDNIDPSFLIGKNFLREVASAASSKNIPFDRIAFIEATRGLLAAYKRFRADVSKSVGAASVRGIPIGSLAARLIANLALSELDRFVSSLSGVCHYARYVDDILVVRELSDGEESRGRDTVNQLLPIDTSASVRRRGYVLDQALLKREGSHFVVQPAKLRLFELEGEQGLEYLSAVKAELDRVSSERRRFLEPWGEELDHTVMASPGAEPVRALREADALSLRKLAVGTVCDKVLTAAAMLSRDDAAKFSRRYLGKAGRLATDWSRWVELIDVSLRILGAALVSGDKETANEVVDSILRRAESLVEGSSRSFKVHWGRTRIPLEQARRMLREWVESQLIEVICSASVFDEEGFALRGFAALEQGVRLQDRLLVPAELLATARLLAVADLRLVDRETDLALGVAVPSRDADAMLLMERALTGDAEWQRRLPGIRLFIEACSRQSDPTYSRMTAVAILLMFKPPSYVDIMFRWLRAEGPLHQLLEVVNAVRGTAYTTASMTHQEGMVIVETPSRFTRVDASGPRPRVILGNLCTEEGWWKASLSAPDVSQERQDRLTRVVNQALDAEYRGRNSGRPTLLVLPELSLPRLWVRELARHLGQISQSGPALSLVAGLEYAVIGKAVYNEVIAFLPRGFAAAAGGIWTKRRVAYHEGQELERAGYQFATRGSGSRFDVMVSEHGKFIPLICSELMEVDTRAELLGRVDLVLVPSWNQDATSFEYFIHSSTLELHSFVAVANNGIFSDCRARGPYADLWQREVCRLIARGENEIVVADLPIDLLREYRSSPAAYERKRREWLQKAKESGQSAAGCPWPAWKPVPPGMPT
jgi:predicted amidohydrolase